MSLYLLICDAHAPSGGDIIHNKEHFLYCILN